MEQREAREIYADGYSVSVNKITATIDFGVALPEGENRVIVRVRMNPLVAKMLTMTLRKCLKTIESRDNIAIVVNQDVLNQQGIALEDW